MWFDCKKQKGVLDRSFVPLKIPLHKENDYDEVLQTCIEHVSYNLLSDKTFLYVLLLKVWKDAPEGDCFIADGSGSRIGGRDFPLTRKDGPSTTLPWTLSNYIKLSGATYPSRVRLYCVNLHTISGKTHFRVLHSVLFEFFIQRVIKVNRYKNKIPNCPFRQKVGG